MQAIRTKYHGPTNTKGARISARCQAGTIYLPYAREFNAGENHRAACEAMLRKLDWIAPHHAPMVGGTFGDAWYWVFVDDIRTSAIADTQLAEARIKLAELETALRDTPVTDDASPIIRLIAELTVAIADMERSRGSRK